MKYDEEIWEDKMHGDVFKMKSTLLYIKEDIPEVMKNVTYSSYDRAIPNLFERLVGYKNELLSIEQEVDSTLQEINIFANRIDLLTIHEAPNAVIISEETHNILNAQVEKLKTDYAKTKGEILNFTANLKNEK